MDNLPPGFHQQCHLTFTGLCDIHLNGRVDQEERAMQDEQAKELRKQWMAKGNPPDPNNGAHR